jgi:hypothetical protein
LTGGNRSSSEGGVIFMTGNPQYQPNFNYNKTNLSSGVPNFKMLSKRKGLFDIPGMTKTPDYYCSDSINKASLK